MSTQENKNQEEEERPGYYPYESWEQWRSRRDRFCETPQTMGRVVERTPEDIEAVKKRKEEIRKLFEQK